MKRRPKPIALPPVSQHLREFAARRDAWWVLARNLVPVIGIYVFSWSVALTVFNYWFDGLAAVAAVLAALTPRAVRDSRKAHAKPGRLRLIGTGIVTWLILLAIVGLPYWIVLIPLHGLLLGPELRAQLAHNPVLWITFAMMATSHFQKAFRVGYDVMPEVELKQRARWDLYLLLLRAMAILLVAASIFVVVLVPVLALILSYFEIWPERVLGLVFGDPARLHELDPDRS
jgi:hypothetical protein